jgi:hypothetical protein
MFCQVASRASLKRITMVETLAWRMPRLTAPNRSYSDIEVAPGFERPAGGQLLRTHRQRVSSKAVVRIDTNVIAGIGLCYERVADITTESGICLVIQRAFVWVVDRYFRRERGSDLPPLKWSSLKYVLTMEDEINGEEEAYG